MKGYRVLRQWFVCAGLVAGVLALCGCNPSPEAAASLLPKPIVEINVPDQLPPFLMATGGGPQVFLLLGYNDIYSTGLMELSDKINAEGVAAKWLNGTDWIELVEEIKKAHAAGTLPGDLMFVGHSFGGDDAVNLARKLNADSIPIRLIALIDGTSPAPIPPNVDYCYNLYKPTWGGDLFPNTFAGNPVEREAGNTHTQINNVEVSISNFGWAANSMEHFSIESEPLIHQAVVAKIKEIAAISGPAAGG